MSKSNNKRIAKNTFLLYIRMLFTMVVSLYTSRVVLEVLGVVDYGVYNVVGGFVAFFSVFSGSLTIAISRFITFELGKGDKLKLSRVFSTSVNIQIAMSLVIVLLSELVGLWFLNFEMNIPDGRLHAANWVLQCSIIGFVLNLINVPYNAEIIAHERMSVFAYMSIFDVLAKLCVAYLLYVCPFDKLVLYALFLVVVSLVNRIVYGIYCKRNFEEATYQLLWDKTIFKEMLGFAGWNFFGNTAYMLNTQGVNMLINIFFGVAMNAARGIAVQVDNAVMGFVNNFSMAIQPQITKTYASGEYHQMFKLINRGTKFSAYIMFFFMIPFVLEAETILSLWLKKVPESSVVFMQLVLFASFCSAIGNYLYYGIMATGKIKHYQLVVTAIGVFVFPLTWLAYKMGFHAATTYIIYGIIYVSLNIIRVNTLKRLVGYQRLSFILKAVGPVLIVGLLSMLPALLVVVFIESSILRFVFTTVVSVLSIAFFAYKLGLEQSEKTFVRDKLVLIINRIHRK